MVWTLINTAETALGLVTSFCDLMKLFRRKDDSEIIERMKQLHLHEMELLIYTSERFSERTRENFQRIISECQQLINMNQESLDRLAGSPTHRQLRADYINNLGIQVQQSDSILLVGPKGMGKSTFLWLLGLGSKPKQIFADGTVQTTRIGQFIDTIGLDSWSIVEFVKLLVLMIYEGLPKDLIIFTNERIAPPITVLMSAGIKNPLIVALSNEVWNNIDDNKVNLVSSTNGFREVVPPSDLDKVYQETVYKKVQCLGMGTPVTHHNVKTILNNRRRSGF